MASYQYRKLEHADSIRLLEVHPASDLTSPIMCTLRHARLSVRPTFEAMSYTWGDNTIVHSIHVDGTESLIAVWKNCYSLLQNIRLTDRVRIVWIDAICIDQTNLDERGHQVMLMDRIYAVAPIVVVYLGEHSDGSRALFEELVEAEEVFQTTQRWYNRPEPSKSVVKALDKLIQRPWFRRVWVIQEVCINPSIFFMCGSARVTKEALFECMYGYRTKKVLQNQIPELCRVRRTDENNAAASLWTLLLECRNFLATDPRDKIFALRSMIQNERQRSAMNPLVDYTQSVAQTFTKTSFFLMSAMGLRLLTATRHPHDMNMPSWIPDFSQTVPLKDLHWPLSMYDADSMAKMFKSNSRGGGYFKTIYHPPMALGTHLLEVPGLQLGNIRRMSLVFSLRDVEDAMEQKYALYNSVPNMQSYAKMEIPKSVGTSIFLDAEFIEAMNLCNPYVLEQGLHRAVGGSIERGQTFYDSMKQCRLVLMDNKQLVIAPAAADEGDVVCLLQGGQSACILRPYQQRYWKLISGDCRVFGNEDFMSPEDFHSDIDEFSGPPIFPYSTYCEKNKERMEIFTIC